MSCESPAPEEQLAVTVPGARAGRNGAGRDPGPGRRPESGAARAPAGRAALPRAAGFWLVAVVLFLLLLPVVAASPLYRVYQAEWRFSATTLTVVFGVYGLTLLATLLVFGSLSDYLGRRGVIAVALAAGAGACGLFLAAHGVGLLFAARALQGAAVGAATSAAGAALIDLQPEGSGRAPVVSSADVQVSFALGGLGTSALVQYAPAPTHLVWWLLLGASAAAAVAVLAIPETVPRRPGVLASLRPRAAVPRQARGMFAVALPVMIAAPALIGFYLSLGPSLAAQVLRSPDLLWGGLGDLPGPRDGGRGHGRVPRPRRPCGHAGRLPVPAGRRRDDPRRDPSGIGCRVPGRRRGGGRGRRHRVLPGRLPPPDRTGRPPPAGWTGRRHLDRLLPGIQRPVVAAGVATTHFGLHQTADVYSAALAVLAAAAAGIFLFRRRFLPRVPAQPHKQGRTADPQGRGR